MVLVVVAVLFVLSIIIAVTVPQFLMRTGETLTKDLVVQANVRSIQTGIEAYAADHAGAYPAAGEVNSIGLIRVHHDLAGNPYTDLPMSDGGGRATSATTSARTAAPTSSSATVGTAPS